MCPSHPLEALHRANEMLVNRTMFLEHFREQSLPELFPVPGALKHFRSRLISEAE